MTMMMMMGTNLEQRGLSGKGGLVQKTAAQFVAQKQLFLERTVQSAILKSWQYLLTSHRQPYH